MDGREDGLKRTTGDGDFCKLEGDGPGMADNTGSDLDKAGLQAGERPVCDSFGQISTVRKNPEIAGQCMKLKPHLVVAKPLAGQPRPVAGLLTFLDVLLGGATLVVETDDPIGVHRQVGYDKANTWKQLTRMPFHPGDHSTGLVP